MARTEESTSRRTVLKIGSGAAVGIVGAPLLGACAGGDNGSPDESQRGKVELPQTIKNERLKYDIAPSEDGIIPGFLFNYPQEPPKTVDSPPANGGTTNAACEINTPLPLPMERNPVWQQVNKQLQTTLAINYSPTNWQAKQQTILASGDLPDLVELNNETPNLPDVCQRLFADLTEHLSGDRIAEYPNLALNSAVAWNQVVFGSGIYGIPQSRPRVGGIPLRTRSDILDKLGVNAAPKNGDELIQLMKDVTDAKANRWASSRVFVDLFAQMMDAPNGWQEQGGKFTSAYETEPYEKALDIASKLWKDGVYHPDAFATGIFPRAFDAGQAVIEYGAFDPGVRYQVGSAGNPSYRVGFIPIPRFDGGGSASAWLGNGFYGFTGLKKAPKNKIEELLRVLNWLAAPTGTAEGTLARFGIRGRNYDLANGSIVAKPETKAELLVLGYIAYAPVVYTSTEAAITEIFRDMHEALTAQYKTAKDNPTYGLYSPTAFSQGASWTKRMSDGQNEIVQGRKDMRDWRELVNSWKSGIGNAMRSEYEKAFAERN